MPQICRGIYFNTLNGWYKQQGLVRAADHLFYIDQITLNGWREQLNSV